VDWEWIFGAEKEGVAMARTHLKNICRLKLFRALSLGLGFISAKGTFLANKWHLFCLLWIVFLFLINLTCWQGFYCSTGLFLFSLISLIVFPFFFCLVQPNQAFFMAPYYVNQIFINQSKNAIALLIKCLFY